MISSPVVNRFGWYVDNWDANPDTNYGVAVTPGASNVEGTPWLELISDSVVTADIWRVMVQCGAGDTSTQAKNHLLDIGIDPAGGTSYSAIISNIVCGGAGSMANGGRSFVFPIRIPAGSAIAVRIQGSNATAGTVDVAMKCWGKPSHPEVVPLARVSETIGTITNSNGVSFTPGNAADGTWQSLGTTTRALWHWQLAVQLDNSNTSAERCWVDLAYGDGSNKHIITRLLHNCSANTEVSTSSTFGFLEAESYCPVPAGGELWVRGRADSAPLSGYNAVAIGCG